MAGLTKLQRLFRFMRSIQFIIAVFCFSCLLAFIFVLYQPTPGPGIIQKLGWQSWDTVSLDTLGDGRQRPKPTSTSEMSAPTAQPEVDWWNVSNSQTGKVDTASFPLDIWNPLLPHDTGLSEIAIERCVVDPRLVDICSPRSMRETDSVKGHWVRVERNLNKEVGMWHLNLYYRRTRRRDVPMIVDLRLLPQRETPPSFDQSWHKVARSIRDGIMRSPPLYLWYRTGKTLQEMTLQERQENLITELDVLFGEDRPWYGFERLEPPTTPFQQDKSESAWVTYRRGIKQPPKAPPLHFSRDGKFKVLQVADLHYSVSQGECRDTDLVPCTHSDNLTSTLLGRVLEAERPSLVVFTGDQLNGQGTSWDARSVIAKFASAVTDQGIPWTAVFGNHDDESSDVSKEIHALLLRSLPYSLFEIGPKDVHGISNYVLKVLSADASKTHLLTLYFVDSGSYSRGFINWWGWFTPTAYDWIRQSQIDWFLQESSSIKPIERPFSPDTGRDLGNIWPKKRQSGDQVVPAKKLAKPNALMFFHIPLQEAFGMPDMDPTTGKPLDIGIHGLEATGAAEDNEGFFDKGIRMALESDHLEGGSAREVKVVANGHCHVTENCRRIKGVWMCFGGVGSYSGYARLGFDRRFRIYDISDYGETIRTYKRTEKDEIVDEMWLTGPQAPRYDGP